MTLSVRIPPQASLAMDPAQQHTPNSKESHLAAMERAYADSEARHAKQFDMLLNGFLKLEKMLQEQHPPPTPPKKILRSISLPSGLSQPDDLRLWHFPMSMTEIDPKDRHFLLRARLIYTFVWIPSTPNRLKSLGCYHI